MTDPAPKPLPLSKTNWITLTGLFLALGVVLPVDFTLSGSAAGVSPDALRPLLAGFLVGPFSD